MTSKNGDVQETRYDLNPHQWMVVKKETIQNTFKKLKFPLLILDLEFFNRSHNTKHLKDRWCDLATGQSYVYLLQFAIYPNFHTLIKNEPQEMIRNLALKRNQVETNYSFVNKYKTLTNDFIDILIKHQIKTIVVAGASNDQQIINYWLADYEKQKAKIIKIEFWDIYSTLEQTMAFANLTANGEVFWTPSNLKKGFSGDNTLSLPSLKKFFSYMTTVFPNFAYNDDSDIYRLSSDILEFFCRTKLDLSQYQKGNKAFQIAKTHCFNDVYKLITLLKYWASLVFDKDQLKKFPRI